MSTRSFPLLLLVFLGSCLLFALTPWTPHVRLWGVNPWLYFPAPARFLALGLAALAGCITVVLLPRSTQSEESRQSWIRLLAGLTAIALVAAFIVFRNKVHFLGDGYQLLATLPSDQPYLKSRNLGGMLLPYLLMQALGGPTKDHALAAYQIVSVSSGVIFLALAYLFARAITEKPVNRLLLWLGLSTSGYLLLFCGYVENYSAFLVAILLMCFVGTAADTGRVSRWWLWPAYLLTALFHVFGLALLPAAVYQFMKSSPSNSWLKSPRVQRIVWASGTLIGLGVFGYLAAMNLFFRFAFVSPIPTRFTVAGYTLFSAAHLLDWLNLVFVLLPCIVLFAIQFPRYWSIVKADHAGIRFLTLASLSLLGIAFVIDPGLGMPRDWDLFACAGVPLTLLAFTVMASGTDTRSRATSALAVILNLTLLVPRVGAMASPEKGLEVAREYIRLDPHKCVTYSYVVLDYVHEHYGADSALALQHIFEPMFPDDREVDSGQVLTDQGRFPEAEVHFRRAVGYNPMNYSAWASLGGCFLETAQYDSARSALTIAAGINPYSSVIAGNLAYAYYYSKDYQTAEKYWLASRKLDTSQANSLVGLATLYSTLNDDTKYGAYFDSVISRKDAPPDYLVAAAAGYLQAGRLDIGARFLLRAKAQGAAESQIEELVEKYPGVKSYL